MATTIILRNQANRSVGRFITHPNTEVNIDPLLQPPLSSIDAPVAFERKITSISDAVLGRTIRHPVARSPYIGEMYVRFELAVGTGALNEVQTLTLSAASTGTLFEGTWFIIVNDTGESTSSFDETTSAASVQTAINLIPSFLRRGISVAVVLTSGTLAAGSALYTITFVKDGARSQLSAMGNLIATATTVGDVASWANATSTAGIGYKSFPGLNIIEKIKLKHGNTVIHEYEYELPHEWPLSRRSNPRTRQVLRASGGEIFESGFCIAPLGFFWSKYLHDQGHVFPFPMNMLNRTELTLELTLRNNTSFTDSGVTAVLSNTDLIIHELNTTTEKEQIHRAGAEGYNMVGWDFQTKIQTIVATGVETSIDLSGFTGDITALVFTVDLVSDVDTNNDRFNHQQLDSYKLVIDGSTYIEVDSHLESIYENFLFGRQDGIGHMNADYNLYNDNQGHLYEIPFGIEQDSPDDYTGGLDVTDVNQLTLKVTHTLGANAYVNVMSVRHVRYLIERGVMLKLE